MYPISSGVYCNNHCQTLHSWRELVNLSLYFSLDEINITNFLDLFLHCRRAALIKRLISFSDFHSISRTDWSIDWLMYVESIRFMSSMFVFCIEPLVASRYLEWQAINNPQIPVLMVHFSIVYSIFATGDIPKRKRHVSVIHLLGSYRWWRRKSKNSIWECSRCHQRILQNIFSQVWKFMGQCEKVGNMKVQLSPHKS